MKQKTKKKTATRKTTKKYYFLICKFMYEQNHKTDRTCWRRSERESHIILLRISLQDSKQDKRRTKKNNGVIKSAI